MTDGDLPFGKVLAVRMAERRMAPTADMPVEGDIKARHTRFSFTRDLTRSPTTPCLHDTTTGGATGAGNETTETKAGTGTGIETETETVIRAAGAAAPAARDDQACTTNPHFFFTIAQLCYR
jgi:hypothetical protein